MDGTIKANILDINVIQLPTYRSKLTISGEFYIMFEEPVPNQWRRFWYWALLGWKWKEINE